MTYPPLFGRSRPARIACASLLVLDLGLCLCWQGTAWAVKLCDASSTAVNFGGYLPSDTTDLTSTGSITVTCTAMKTITIALSTGQSGSFDPRRMSGGSPVNQLQYYLYTNPAHTILWGDGTGQTQTVTSQSVKNGTVMITVYGLLPKLQNVNAGNYTDSITATVTY